MKANMLNFSAFSTLHPAGQETVSRFLEDARRTDNPITRFSYVWMSFNAWLNCVSGEVQDAKMIKAASTDPRMNDLFSEVREEDGEFRERINEFAEWWPIFSVQDVRRYGGPNAPYEFQRRDDFYNAHRADRRLRRRPDGWVSGRTPRWPDLLAACYQVRCNLFHGDKSIHNQGDREIIKGAERCLSGFIQASCLYEI
jgi:hypothetical protein